MEPGPILFDAESAALESVHRAEIRELYKEHDVDYKLANLTPAFLNKGSKKAAKPSPSKAWQTPEAEPKRPDANTTVWHIMPKLHMFQHIAEAPHCPKEYWCYRDETMGGELAHLFLEKVWEKSWHQKWQQENTFPAIPL